MTTNAAENNLGRGMLYAGLIFACFSSGDAALKWLTTGFNVFQLTCIASMFSLIPVVWLVMRTGGLRSIRPRHPGWVGVRTLLLVGESLCCYFAFSRLPLAEVYPVIFATPILVTLLSVPLLGEKVGWRRILAVIVGFVGVLIVIRPGMRGLDAGHAAALASTLMFALSMIVLRRMGDENYGALLVTLVCAKIVVGAVLTPFFGGFAPMTWADLGLMAVVGLFAGAAHIFLVLAIRYAPAAVVSPFQYSQMLWGVFYGALLFGDWPDTVTLTGAGVIILSGLIILWREKEKAQPVESAKESTAVS